MTNYFFPRDQEDYEPGKPNQREKQRSGVADGWFNEMFTNPGALGAPVAPGDLKQSSLQLNTPSRHKEGLKSDDCELFPLWTGFLEWCSLTSDVQGRGGQA